MSMKVKYLLILALLLCSSCRILYLGTHAIPTVCTTKLTGTPFSITLHKPHDGDYFYGIDSSGGNSRHYGTFGLRTAKIDESVPPRLDDLGDGLFKVTWGKSPDEAFVKVDTSKQLIIEDSNEYRPKNLPFEPSW